MPIRLGALPHTITPLIFDRETGTMTVGAAIRARVDPVGANDGVDVPAGGEASWQLVAAPGAETLRAEDAFLFGELLLYCYGDAQAISAGIAGVHHVELDARTALGYADDVIVSRPSGRNDGTLDDATGVWTRTPGVEVYRGPARIVRPTSSTSPNDAGASLSTDASFELFLPWLDPTDPTALADGTDEVEPFYSVEVTDSPDPSLAGLFFQTVARGHASPAHGREFDLELVEASAP